MKLVKGRALTEVFGAIHEGKAGWTLERGLQVVVQVGQALAYAHQKGAIHRDLKPGNVMVGRYGAVYVMDWGLSRVLDKESTYVELDGGVRTRGVQSIRNPGAGAAHPDLLTQEGSRLGTPYYMAPEQARGEANRMGPLTDVYGVGALLYHLFAGAPPYFERGKSSTANEVTTRIRSAPPAPLDRLAPEIPGE